MYTTHIIIEVLAGAAFFFNALFFIPQILKLAQTKDSKGLSLTTFAGFNAIQLIVMIHGYINQDLILFFGTLLSFITCGIVTIMILIYH